MNADSQPSSEMGRVIVVIPVRERAQMLQRAVESVLRQTWRDYDLVVVDDASRLEDLSIVRNLVESSGHHWLSFDENRGPAAARNAGVLAGEQQGTQWVAFLDSDDVWKPEKLERQLLWHADYPEVGVSQCQEAWIRNGVKVGKKRSQLQPEGRIFAQCIDSCCISPSCMMMTLSLWKELGGFDERYRVCEDYELWLRLSLKNPVGLVRDVPDPLVIRHGGHEDQLSFSIEAMDRFRVMAMLELLLNGSLGQEETVLVEKGIARKSEILEQGARKRSLRSHAEVYGLAGKQEWEKMAREMENLCFRI